MLILIASLDSPSNTLSCSIASSEISSIRSVPILLIFVAFNAAISIMIPSNSDTERLRNVVSKEIDLANVRIALILDSIYLFENISLLSLKLPINLGYVIILSPKVTSLIKIKYLNLMPWCLLIDINYV